MPEEKAAASCDTTHTCIKLISLYGQYPLGWALHPYMAVLEVRHRGLHSRKTSDHTPSDEELPS